MRAILKDETSAMTQANRDLGICLRAEISESGVEGRWVFDMLYSGIERQIVIGFTTERILRVVV